MTTSATVRGGSINLRNRLLYERTSDQIIQFLSEGNTHPTPIAYTLTPIWEILRRHSRTISENKNARIQALNLEAYFYVFRLTWYQETFGVKTFNQISNIGSCCLY